MTAVYLKVFFTAFLLSLFLTPIVRRFAFKYNLIAKPKKDRWNRRVIPLCGGIAIFLSFAASFILYGRGNPLFPPILGGAAAVFLCGLSDDIIGIKPYSKLFFQIVIASFMCICGINFEILPLAVLNIFFTVFWFVAIMNAFNLLDNMDGLCVGIAVISAGIVFAYYGFSLDYNVAILALIIGAASLGFLRYNFHPAKIFMGDCGSMFIGFIMALISVMGTRMAASNLLAMLAIPVLVLGVPVFDTIFVTLTRRANGRHFYEGGKDHTSHRLVVLGMTEKRTVLTLYFMSLGCGLVAFMYTRLNIAVGIILIMVVVLLMVFFGIFLSQVKISTKDKEIKSGPGEGNIYLGGMIYHKQRMFEMAVDFLLICMSYIAAYLLRYEGVLNTENLNLIVASLPILIIIKLSSLYIFGLYKGVWQYVGVYDLFNIFKAVSFGSLISVVALAFIFRFLGYSRAVFIIDWLIFLIAVSAARLAIRFFREYFFRIVSPQARKILIMGAGDAGEYLLRGLKYNRKLKYTAVGFLDDNENKNGWKIHGIPILGTRKDIPALAEKYKLTEVVVAIPSLSEASFAQLVDICSKSGINCRKMSELALW